MARRLEKFGVNLVRLDQLDADGRRLTFFSVRGGNEKGIRWTPRTRKAWIGYDYLIHCLKEQGIYVYIDLLTYRKFKADDGVASAHLLPLEAGRPYSTFDRMFDLQKAYNEKLFNHVNPYTGLAYKEDPAHCADGNHE